MSSISNNQLLSSPIRTVHLQLAVFELLRRLGFPAADIYVSWDSVKKCPYTVLKQGQKSFDIRYDGALEHPDNVELYEREWVAESTRWNTSMEMEERLKIFTGFVTVEMTASVMMSLRQAGYYIPKIDN